MLPTHFEAILAAERQRDVRERARAAGLRRTARRIARERAGTAPAPTGEVVLRWARDADRPAVVRLAELDSRPLPVAPVLLAEVDGEPLAALSVRDRAVVADPFRPTNGLVGLLALRAAQLPL